MSRVEIKVNDARVEIWIGGVCYHTDAPNRGAACALALIVCRTLGLEGYSGAGTLNTSDPYPDGKL